MKNIKLIWDFRGPDGQKIAEHHLVHIKEYITAENLDVTITGIETITEMHSIAFLVVEESKMIALRDALKPHRGEWYES